jgi:hypothetical protein
MGEEVPEGREKPFGFFRLFGIRIGFNTSPKGR